MNFFHNFQGAPRRGMALISLGALCGSALLAGCGGGSSSSNNTNSPEIRSVDTVSNGGGATISVNGSQVDGRQGYFSSSPYTSVGNSASSVTFSLSNASNTTFLPVTDSFSIGNYYSVILVGRADVTTTTDPRYPSVIVTSDSFTTLSGNQASLRLIHAAPDAGSIDVTVNGSVIASGIAYKSVSADIGETSGNVTVGVNQTGTSTALIAPQTINLTGGHVYTVYIVEPTITPTPVYGLQETDDTATAFPSG